MHTPTIYDKDFIDSDYVLVNKDKLHHLENVLRVSLGSKVHVSNGEGVIGYGVKDKGNIIKIDKKEKFEQENKLSIFLSITNSINRIELLFNSDFIVDFIYYTWFREFPYVLLNISDFKTN